MAKWVGQIGFVTQIEVKPGVWSDGVVEKDYYGELLQNLRRYESSQNLNDNVNISNKISVVADPFANQNLHTMKYLTFMGNKWEIKDVEVAFPRLIISIGGLYNGGEPA